MVSNVHQESCLTFLCDRYWLLSDVEVDHAPTHAYIHSHMCLHMHTHTCTRIGSYAHLHIHIHLPPVTSHFHKNNQTDDLFLLALTFFEILCFSSLREIDRTARITNIVTSSVRRTRLLPPRLFAPGRRGTKSLAAARIHQCAPVGGAVLAASVQQLPLHIWIRLPLKFKSNY